MRDAHFTVAVTLTPPQEQDYARAVGLISVGGDLSSFYRRSTGHDRLLRELQVMHLHLGGAGSDAILYVVQSPKPVLFVRIDTHIHLDDIPPGRRLSLLGRREFERQLAVDRASDARILAAARDRLLRGPGKGGSQE